MLKCLRKTLLLMLKDNKPYRILVIEDNPGDLTIVEDFLTEQILAPVIVHADSFKQAVGILSLPGTPVFDVILLDLSLSDSSGEKLVNEMLGIAAISPIIILTGYTDIDFSIKSIGRGILDYLLKEELNATTLYKSIVYAIERKKNISALKESEKRYSDLFYLSPQPMWVFDRDTFRFVQVNKATTALYGYSEEEFLSMTLMDIKMTEDIPKTKESIRKQKPGNGLYKEIVRHYKKSGEIVEVEIYATPLLVNDKKLISVIAIDVTERNHQEHRIVKAIIKTQEDERYEIGGELHDNVCQILAVSQLSLEMLQPSLPSSGLIMYNQCRGNITLALNEIRNLSHRLAPVFFDDTTLEEAFRRLIDSFNIDKKHKISLYFEPGDMKHLISTELQLNLYRVLQEQLRNILKYANASFIEVKVIISKTQLKMRVSDNGIGFNTNEVKKGIGLSNMKRRSELFSGKFEVISSPGNGCAIIIDIPLLQNNLLHPKKEFETVS